MGGSGLPVSYLELAIWPWQALWHHKGVQNQLSPKAKPKLLYCTFPERDFFWFHGVLAGMENIFLTREVFFRYR